MNKCGECSRWIPGGDWGLCCEIDPGLHYEDSDACEKFDPLECNICDEKGGVVLVKYPCTMMYQEKRITFERWSYHCEKCGRKFEPSWMFQQNIGRIKWERRMLEGNK
jgi:hypothetical protein